MHEQSNRATEIMKNSTRLSALDTRSKKRCIFSAKTPPLLSYYCLAEFFIGTHTVATDLQTNFLLTSYWLAKHVTSAPEYKATTKVRSSEKRMENEG